MRLTLEFDMTEEEYEAQCAIKGRAYRATLDEISEMIRTYFKYDMEHTQEKAEDLLHRIRDTIWEEE